MENNLMRAAVFDAYGTLLDFNDAVAREGATLGDRGMQLSELWRRKQLEYTWLRSLMQRHAPFWEVTGDALDFALEALAINDADLRGRLMTAYRTLKPYPEVPDMLRQLQAGGMKTAILSNGSPEMLQEGVAAAGLADLVDVVLSVEDVGVFKPSPEVYQLATSKLAIPACEIAFMSSNCWDIHGAASFGMTCFWINRGNAPDDRLPGQFARMERDLSQLPKRLGQAA